MNPFVSLSEFFAFLTVVCILAFFGLVVTAIWWHEDLEIIWKLMATDWVVGVVSYLLSRVFEKVEEK